MIKPLDSEISFIMGVIVTFRHTIQEHKSTYLYKKHTKTSMIVSRKATANTLPATIACTFSLIIVVLLPPMNL